MTDITPRDLKMLLNSADRHIAALEAEVEDQYGPFSQVPSQNQAHTYVTDRRGIIQLDQDSAFVCLAVVLCGQANYISEGLNNPMGPTYVLSVMQAGPRKYMTFSRNKAPLPTDNNIIELNGAPTEMFIPIANNGGIQPQFRNADFFYRMPIEWQIPRGESIQALFPEEASLGLSFVPGGTLSQRFNAFPKICLAGYKVF